MTSSEQHWWLERDEQGVAWLAFDYQKGGVNVLSHDALQSLSQVLGQIEQDCPSGLVLYSKKSAGFIMGADVKSFDQLKTQKDALDLINLGHDVCNRLEAIPCRKVAMIHGTCLGGGLELALACDFLVACEDEQRTIGLPEVKLGIHPGFGGTVRLMERAGEISALQLMLEGRALTPRQAMKMGIVDAVVPERQLKNTVRRLLVNGSSVKPSLFLRLQRSLPPFLLGMATGWIRRQLARRVRKEHYPAPYKLLNLWKQQLGQERNRQLELEKASIAELFFDETSRNLVRVFKLRSQLSALGHRRSVSKDQKIDAASVIGRVHVVGAGVMGGDIAAWCALKGLQVSLQDMSMEQLGRARKRAWDLVKRQVRSTAGQNEIMDRLIHDPEGYGAAKADLIIEAVIEDEDVKKTLYQQLEERIPATTLIATNTSSIPLEDLSEGLQHPERFLGLHYFNPVAKMPLVEVIAAPRTVDEALDRAYAFVKGTGKLPLPVKSSVGFLVNRILMAYLGEAMILVDEGVPAQEVDEAALHFGMPMGPIALADKVGLDICHHVLKVFDEQLHLDAMTLKAASGLGEKIKKGHLGVKTGQGYYSYKKGRPIDAGRGRTPLNQQAQTRLFARLYNECLHCMEEKVVSDADFLDAGMIFGTGFAPFRGGPMHDLKKRHQQVYADLQALHQRYGERFAPSPGWQTFFHPDQTMR